MISLPSEKISRRIADLRVFIAPLLSDGDLFEATRLTGVRDFTIGVLPFGFATESVYDPTDLRLPTKWGGLYTCLTHRGKRAKWPHVQARVAPN